MDGLEEHGLEKGGGCGSGGDPAFKYVKSEQRDGAVFPQIFPTTLPSTNKEFIAYPEKKRHKKNFSRLLKAILFETSLAKKIKKRKLSKKLNKSEKVEKDSKREKKNSINKKNQDKKDDGRNISNRSPSNSSSLFRNSRLLLDTGRSFRSNSIKFKPEQDNMQGNGEGSYSSTVGLCLLLISLVALVFWGKACAILKNLSQKIADYEGIDLEEYKKKIIMEGLLERNRNRVL
ncbi:unnamed protein product [Dovyalis caffra]|uniref:Uncharacterized protein n=1 Tax=Dovyalis caffra TaxID=77055 RepID=A0AAV1R0T7_9ROSI|nr:unnamed protein product [Dovyalis caffra]